MRVMELRILVLRVLFLKVLSVAILRVLQKALKSQGTAIIVIVVITNILAVYIVRFFLFIFSCNIGSYSRWVTSLIGNN